MTVTTHPQILHNPNCRPRRAANQCKTQCQPLTMGTKNHLLGLILNIIIHQTLICYIPSISHLLLQFPQYSFYFFSPLKHLIPCSFLIPSLFISLLILLTSSHLPILPYIFDSIT
ncbi:hypothetical protein AMTRI_Chr02g264850 [Amborella trichopoda]